MFRNACFALGYYVVTSISNQPSPLAVLMLLLLCSLIWNVPAPSH